MVQDVSRARLTVISLLIITLLATLVARLWFLQVLTGQEAQQLAERTSIRLIHQRAPRGFVYDRNGTPLATNRTALTVALDVSRLPEDRREEVIPKLAYVLGLSEEDVREVIEDPRLGYYTPRPIALDVPKDTVIYLLEHQDEYPGVTALEIPVRQYPQGRLGSHVIGHIGEVNAEELEERNEELDENAPKRYRPGDKIGKIGVESVYEGWLRGVAGIQKIAVNVRGEKVENINTKSPERGWDAVLTLDADVQRAAEDGLQKGMELARRLVDPDSGETYEAPAGAVIALDPATGEILALTSKPDFDPNVFVPPVAQEEVARLNTDEANKPMFNRAIAELAPPASTFKAITAMAAWDANLVGPESTFNCPGYFDVGRRTFRDWKPEGHGRIGLTGSLVESCDVVYYTLGVGMDEERDRIGEQLQETARDFGFGSKTGIDLLGEQSGLVPDAEWKEETFSYAQPYDRRWFPGDAANLAIGQGFLQATPLQLAVAYGAIANGGTLYRPHVLKCIGKLNVSQTVSAEEVCAMDGSRTPESASPRVIGQVPVPPGALDFMREAMAGVGLGDGTAAAAFSGFPFDQVAVAGKTGTAQVVGRQPFSWFAAFAPAHDPEIVVVAMVEEAGNGSQIAAPIVRRVIERHFGLPEGDLEAGARAD